MSAGRVRNGYSTDVGDIDAYLNIRELGVRRGESFVEYDMEGASCKIFVRTYKMHVNEYPQLV